MKKLFLVLIIFLTNRGFAASSLASNHAGKSICVIENTSQDGVCRGSGTIMYDSANPPADDQPAIVSVTLGLISPDGVEHKDPWGTFSRTTDICGQAPVVTTSTREYQSALAVGRLLLSRGACVALVDRVALP